MRQSLGSIKEREDHDSEALDRVSSLPSSERDEPRTMKFSDFVKTKTDTTDNASPYEQ